MGYFVESANTSTKVLTVEDINRLLAKEYERAMHPDPVTYVVSPQWYKWYEEHR